MEPSSRPFRLDALLAHREWVERTARALVFDDADAEDLTQQAWLGILERPPGSAPASPRGWLRSVLRFTAIDAGRAARARREHEGAVARRERLEADPADVVARAETLDRLVHAVLELEEPYRSTVLLRYFEDLPPRDVAARQGVPVETVRTRVKRAMAQLRERLDAESGGDRRGWCPALVPFLGRSSPGAALAASAGTALTTGGVLMANKVLVAATAVLLLGGIGWFALRPGEPAPRPVVTGSAPGAAPSGQRTRTPAPVPAPPPAPATVPLPSASCRLRVVVVDGTLRPIPRARAEVRPAATPGASGDPVLDRDDTLAPAPASGTSAADGTLTIPLPAGRWAVTVRADGYGAVGATADLQEGAVEDPLRIVLFPAATLEGTVLRSPGSPRPGVVVEARPIGNDGLHARVAAAADGAGKYKLEGLPPGRILVSVRLASGVVRAAGVVEVPGTSRFDILLPGGATVRGRVVDDATGEPLRGAEVGVSLYEVASGLAASGRALAAADGSFAFEDLPPWRVSALSARREGYLPWPDGGAGTALDAGALAVVLAPGTVLEKEVRLRRGAVVRGRVTLGDGTPVPGARVSFTGHVQAAGMTQPRSSPVVFSAPDGAYSAPFVLPGTNFARVEAEGFCAPGSEQAAMMGAKEDPRWTVEVPAGGEVEKDLVLSRGAVVEGLVVDGNGAPVAGARVGVQDPWWEEWSGAAVPAGPDGAFRLAAVPTGDLRLLARGPGGLRGSSNRLMVRDGEALRGVRITTGPGAVLAGTVLGEDGTPVPGARVSVHVGGVVFPGQQKDPGRVAWLRASGKVHPVGPEGGFRIEGLGGGTWTVHATAPGRSPVFRTVDGVRPGTVVEDLRLVLPAGATLSGRILDPAGSPVAGATVFVLPASAGPGGSDGTAPSGTASSDDTGRFRQEGLEEADHLLRVSAPGFAPWAAVVPARTGEIEVRLALPLAIAGRVLVEGGGPAAGVIVTVSPEDRVPGVLLTRETVTGRDGEFRIEGVAAGRHSLYAGGYGGDLVQRKIEGVTAGTLDLAVTLARGLAMRGRLVDDRGRPVPGAQVMVLGEGATGAGVGRNGLAQTLSDGSFRIGGLLPGTYAVVVSIPDSRWSAPPPLAGVRPGEADLLLKVTASGSPAPEPPDGDLRIEGTVMQRGGGAPPTGTTVVALPEAPAASGGTRVLVSARTDERGAFQLDGLREGRYRVVAALRSPSLAPGWSADLVEAGTTGVAVEVSPAVSLSGRVVGTGAESIRWIRALPKGAPSAAFAWAEVGTDSSFSLAGLPEGPVCLEGMLRAGGTVDLGPAAAPGEGVEVRVP